MSNRQLHQELLELTLVATGAVPGALLRWQLEGLDTSNTAANLLGCLLIGLLLSRPAGAPARLMLWAGIGFCGSLTTFSTWMLELVQALEQGAPQAALGILLGSLLGGLAMVGLGRWLGRLRFNPGSNRRSADRARGAAR